MSEDQCRVCRSEAGGEFAELASCVSVVRGNPWKEFLEDCYDPPIVLTVHSGGEICLARGGSGRIDACFASLDEMYSLVSQLRWSGGEHPLEVVLAPEPDVRYDLICAILDHLRLPSEPVWDPLLAFSGPSGVQLQKVHLHAEVQFRHAYYEIVPKTLEFSQIGGSSTSSGTVAADALLAARTPQSLRDFVSPHVFPPGAIHLKSSEVTTWQDIACLLLELVGPCSGTDALMFDGEFWSTSYWVGD